MRREGDTTIKPIDVSRKDLPRWLQSIGVVGTRSRLLLAHTMRPRTTVSRSRVTTTGERTGKDLAEDEEQYSFRRRRARLDTWMTLTQEIRSFLDHLSPRVAIASLTMDLPEHAPFDPLWPPWYDERPQRTGWRTQRRCNAGFETFKSPSTARSHSCREIILGLPPQSCLCLKMEFEMSSCVMLHLLDPSTGPVSLVCAHLDLARLLAPSRLAKPARAESMLPAC